MQKVMKKKATYILILSEVFPKGHPRQGQPTGFREAFLRGQDSPQGEGAKIHTLRGNSSLWEQRAARVNAGKAVLSVRQWSGKPYRKGSTMVEIGRLTRLGIQHVMMDMAEGKPFAIVRDDDMAGRMVSIGAIASGDGLSEEDFIPWFRLSVVNGFNGCILHFTDFRY